MIEGGEGGFKGGNLFGCRVLWGIFIEVDLAQFLGIWLLCLQELEVLKMMQLFLISHFGHLLVQFGVFLEVSILLLEFREGFVLFIEPTMQVEVVIEEEDDIVAEELEACSNGLE